MTKFRVLMSLLLKNHADRPGEGKGGRFEERDDRFEERRRPERPERPERVEPVEHRSTVRTSSVHLPPSWSRGGGAKETAVFLGKLWHAANLP